MSTTTKDKLEKQRDEVRELQRELQAKRLANLPNEYEDAAEGITAFGGKVHLDIKGEYDREALIALRKRLDRAFQVL